MAPVLVPPDQIHGDTGLFQCSDHADVGQRACPAAAEHQADGAPGEHARQPIVVIREPRIEMMMRAHGQTSEPVGGTGGDALGAIVEQHKLPVAAPALHQSRSFPRRAAFQRRHCRQTAPGPPVACTAASTMKAPRRRRTRVRSCCSSCSCNQPARSALSKSSGSCSLRVPLSSRTRSASSERTLRPGESARTRLAVKSATGIAAWQGTMASETGWICEAGWMTRW